MIMGYWDYNSDVSNRDYSLLIKYHFQDWDAIENETNYHVPDAQKALAVMMETNANGYTDPWDITGGLENFFASRGYPDSYCYNMDLTWDYSDANQMHYDIRSHIDQQKPPMLGLNEYYVAAVGYASSTHFVAFHDPNVSTVLYAHISEIDEVYNIHPHNPRGIACELINPDGGQGWGINGYAETWYANSVHEVKWTGDLQWTDTYATLYYNTDGGELNTPWIPITTNTPNDGSYDWLVPSGVISNTCRVKIEMYNSSHALIGSDGSHGNFAIQSGGSVPVIPEGNAVDQTRNPMYYQVNASQLSWAALASQRQGEHNMGVTLYQSPS
ncbi:MAG: hypothetical protein U1C33_01005, partial [Candidatus Cloacimonadaceae bacterium]|nr:hypothetical protein [Candidatus Cloacimonadaceae bacterium]